MSVVLTRIKLTWPSATYEPIPYFASMDPQAFLFFSQPLNTYLPMIAISSGSPSLSLHVLQHESFNMLQSKSCTQRGYSGKRSSSAQGIQLASDLPFEAASRQGGYFGPSRSDFFFFLNTSASSSGGCHSENVKRQLRALLGFWAWVANTCNGN